MQQQQPTDSDYGELAPSNGAESSAIKRLRGGAQICFISSRCRLKLERRYLGLRAATGELVMKKSQLPDDRAEPLLDMMEVMQVTLLTYATLPYDLLDLNDELPMLGMYPNRLLIRYRGNFVPQWLLLLDAEHLEHWRSGLLSYVQLLQQLPSEGLVELYMWREYYRLASVGNTFSQFYSEENLQPEDIDPAWNLCVSDKELKDWLANNLNALFKPSRLSDLLLNYLPNYRRNCGSFETFARLRQLCLWSSQKALDNYFMQYFPRVTQFSSEVLYEDLERFMQESQGETAETLLQLQQSSGVPLTDDNSIQFASFLDMLFCKANGITDSSRTEQVYQNMDLPLSAYYISTSHNTYLTGDQLRSESSVQCYISALRQGCRCVELDLWDGPKDTPIIYHGHTMTSKIDLEPVLLAIRDHAFERSSAPVILSLEDHCCLQQQARTADLLVRVLGQALLTAPVGPDGVSQLPSPAQLCYRVLVKHAKQQQQPQTQRIKVISSPVEASATAAAAAAAVALSLGSSATAAASATSPSSSASGPSASTAAAGDSTSIHSGRVTVQNPITDSWEPYVAVLTESELLFMSDEFQQQQAETAATAAAGSPSSGVELLGSAWYHADANRQEAERRIRLCSLDEDGRFLVRPSVNNPGDYTLSFMNRGVIRHCHIRSTPDPENPNYSLYNIPNVRSERGTTDTTYFARMSDLIANCQQFGIDHCKYFLTKPVPCDLKQFPWYVGDTSKQAAEQYLRQVPFSGAFLVRKKEGSCLDGEFVLAFRAEREIKRCIISCRGGKAMMGNFSEFQSLPQLVGHFASCPIYRNIRLRYPVNASAVDRTRMSGIQIIDSVVVCESAYTSILQSDDEFDHTDEESTMRATGDYASRAPDELTISQGDVLLDVSQTSPDWWTGTQESSGCRGLVPAALLEPCNTGEYAEMSVPVARITRVRVPHSAEQVAGDRHCCLSIEFLASDSQAQPHQLAMRVPTEDQLLEWLQKLEERRRRFFGRVNPDGSGSGSGSLRRKEKVAQELSDLVIYCVPTRCPEQKIRFRPSRFDEMISIPETRLPKSAAMAQELKDFSLNQLVRVYPKTTRFNSSNFNPTLAWSLGCQMVALNWQTPGRSMLLNRALFADNGGCGFVLKPEFLPDGEPRQVSVQLRVLAGRRLPQLSSRPTCSFVEVELDGRVSRSSTVEDNGLNPVYRDCRLSVTDCLNNSILRIAVMETDAWQDPVVIGQFARPIRTLRQGYRSVQLCNEHGDEIHLASLLVHLIITGCG